MPNKGPDPGFQQSHLTADETYRRTLDSLLEGFQIIGFDWTFVYVNPVAARHGQSTPEKLTGRVIWEAYPGIEQTPLFSVMKECMESRGSQVFENYFTFPDGCRRWFEIRIQAVPEGICIYSADIHDRKVAQLEQSSQTERRRVTLLERLWRTVSGTSSAESRTP